MKKIFLLLICLVSIGFAQNIKTESQHFVFSADEKDLTKEMISFCEERFDIINQKFTQSFDKKIAINIYPDLKTLHAALNYENATEYCCASFMNNEVHIVSFYNPGSVHDDISIKASLAANIEKVILSSNYNLPLWLIDAIGFYERTKFLPTDRNEARDIAIKNLLKDETRFNISSIMNPHSFKDFEKEFALNRKNAFKRAYDTRALANSFIQFVIDNWGYQKLLEMEKGKCLCAIFKMDPADLEIKWFEYTKNIHESI